MSGRDAMTRTAVTTAAVLMLVVAAPAAALAHSTLRWESWGENATAGSASEGTHAWVSRGLYERGVELGMEPGTSAGITVGIMAAWELCEVETMDTQGVSVQDLAANALGALSGLTGLGMRYSYATYANPEPSEEHPWLDVPVLPRNDLTYAIELEHDGWTMGYKYLGLAGDLVVGTTSMPVQAGEWGKQRVVGYVGREWDSGWHCAVGYDGLGEVSAGVGYRLVLWGIGIDLNALEDGDGPGVGASCFVDYGSVFGR